MDEFLTATLTFPTVLFTFTLVIVAAYWLLVLVGGAAVEWGDGDAAAPAGHDVHGLGGVPVTIVVSVLVTLAWFLCLIGSIVLGHLGFGGALGLLSGFLILLVAITLAVVATRAVVIPLRRVFGAATAPVRDDFVGRVCVIRTSWVGPDFGQAELTSSDGSSAIIQVRQTAAHVSEIPLTQGVSAVVYDYDSAAEIFWVAAIEEGIS